MTHVEEWIAVQAKMEHAVDRGYFVLDPGGFGKNWYLKNDAQRKEQDGHND